MKFKLLILMFLILPSFVYAASCCSGVYDPEVDCTISVPCTWNTASVIAKDITINAVTDINPLVPTVFISASGSITINANMDWGSNGNGDKIVLNAINVYCDDKTLTLSGTDGSTGSSSSCSSCSQHNHGSYHSRVCCSTAETGGPGVYGRDLVITAQYAGFACDVFSIGGTGGVGGGGDSGEAGWAPFHSHSNSEPAANQGSAGDGGDITLQISSEDSFVTTSDGTTLSHGLSENSDANTVFVDEFLQGGGGLTPGNNGDVSVETWPGYNSSCLPIELCNNQDDNCDDAGLIDEDLSTCACTNGGIPSMEVCNGIDDNCDGLIDNDCVENRIACIPSNLLGDDCVDFDYDTKDFKKWVMYSDGECPFENKNIFNKIPCVVISRFVDNYKRYDNKRRVLETISHFKFYNKLFNSDFSSGVNGWSGSLSLSNTALFNGIAVQGTGSTNVDVEPNKNYVLSGYTQGGTISVSCSGSDAILGDAGSFVEGSWTRYYQVFTTGSGTTTCEILLSDGLFDGIQLSEGSEIIDYDSGMFSVKYTYNNKGNLISKLNPVGVGEAHAYDLMNNDRFTSINNLIPDPSFELYEGSFLYWSGPFGFNTDAHSGINGLLLNSNDYEVLKYLVPVFPAKSYSLSVFTKGSGAIVLKVKFFDQGNLFISEVEASFSSSTGDFVRKSFSFTTPSTADFVEVYVGKSSGGDIFVDDVSLNEGSVPSPFKILEYTYNPDSTIDVIDYDDGFAVSNFGYTSRRWIDSLETSCILDGMTWTILDEEYEYDASGNLVKVMYPSGDFVSFSYDELDRLTEVDNEGYYYNVDDFDISYDLAGNRVTKGDLYYWYEDKVLDNKLFTDGVYEYEYESDGSVSQRTFILEDVETYGSGTDLFGGNTTFQYYASGLLSTVSFPIYKGEIDSIYYFYDSGNNLAVRKSSWGTTFYVYDNFGDLVYERMDGTDIRRCEIEEEFNEAGRKFIVKEGTTVLAAFDDQGYVKIKGSIIVNSAFNVAKYFSVEEEDISWLIDSEGNLHLKGGWESLVEVEMAFDESITLNSGFFVNVGETRVVAISADGMQVLGCVAMYQDVDQYLE